VKGHCTQCPFLKKRTGRPSPAQGAPCRAEAGRPGTVELIETVCQAAPGLRVRLGSLEPRTVTEDFCIRLAALPGLCPHFHLSLQSGCDETLQRMGRRYDTARYLRSVELLRRHFPKPGITTDLIVGFPEETEERQEPIIVEQVEDGVFSVTGSRVERMLGYTNLDSEKGFEFFQRFLKENGILDKLEELGVEEGDTVVLYDLSFEYYK